MNNNTNCSAADLPVLEHTDTDKGGPMAVAAVTVLPVVRLSVQTVWPNKGAGVESFLNSAALLTGDPNEEEQSTGMSLCSRVEHSRTGL